MTLYSLALRIKEIIDLQTEYGQTNDRQLLLRSGDRMDDLHILVNSIISAYQVTNIYDSQDQYVDVDPVSS